MGIGSLFLLCGSWGLNLGHRTWRQVSLPAEPSQQPNFFLLLAYVVVKARLIFPHVRFFHRWPVSSSTQLQSAGLGCGSVCGPLFIYVWNLGFLLQWETMAFCIILHPHQKQNSLNNLKVFIIFQLGRLAGISWVIYKVWIIKFL